MAFGPHSVVGGGKTVGRTTPAAHGLVRQVRTSPLVWSSGAIRRVRRLRRDRAQFGASFRSFRTLRRRRNELEYPALPDESASVEESGRAIEAAESLVESAEELLSSLGLF
jgi:hypothetical protein